MIPREFFVTGGKALSQVSELNAFDLALKRAGIAQCNLVSVTSIIPPKCREAKRKEILVGSITHVVMAKMAGSGKAKIAAGVAWAWEKNREYGIVAEAHGCVDEEALKEKLERRIREMVEIREIEIEKAKYRTEVLMVPKDNYGCVVAALVYRL